MHCGFLYHPQRLSCFMLHDCHAIVILFRCLQRLDSWALGHARCSTKTPNHHLTELGIIPHYSIAEAKHILLAVLPASHIVAQLHPALRDNSHSLTSALRHASGRPVVLSRSYPFRISYILHCHSVRASYTIRQGCEWWRPSPTSVVERDVHIQHPVALCVSFCCGACDKLSFLFLLELLHTLLIIIVHLLNKGEHVEPENITRAVGLEEGATGKKSLEESLKRSVERSERPHEKSHQESERDDARAEHNCSGRRCS